MGENWVVFARGKGRCGRMRVLPLALVFGLSVLLLVSAERASDEKLRTKLQNSEVPGGDGVKFTDVRDRFFDAETEGRGLFKAKDSAGRWGWYWREGDEIQTIVRTGETLLAGEVKPVEFVGGASRAGDFAVIEAEANGARALVLFDGKRGTSRVILWADGGVPVPGHPKDAILYVSPELSLDERDLVFRVARVESPHLEDSQTRGDRAICGWFDVDLGDPQAFDVANLITVADWTSEVPGYPGRRFTKFDHVAVRDGAVLFAGSGEGFAGMFSFDARADEPLLNTASSSGSHE